MKIRTAKVWILLALLLSALPVAATTTYYVNCQGGSNSNDGLGPGTAWKNIDYATDNSISGDIILVAPGRYNIATGESFPITVDGQHLIATSTHLATIEETGVGAYILILNESASLEGFYLKGNGGSIVIEVSGDNATINNNWVSAEGYAVGVSVDQLMVNPLIEHNRIWGKASVAGYGIFFDSGVAGYTVYRNELWGFSNDICDYSSTGTRTINRNTLITNLSDAVGIYLTSISGAITVKNNIITSNATLDGDYVSGATGTYGIYADFGTVNLSYNNIWKNQFDYYNAGATFNKSNEKSRFPGFVNFSGRNFDLYASTAYWASPCVGAGESGVNIGAYDGAGESGSPYLDTSYVSGSGSDSNTGVSEGQAWRTLTKANAYTVEKINVGAGLYNAANGETVFPINFSLGRYVKGADRTTTTIEASGAHDCVHLNRYSSIEGFTSQGTRSDNLGTILWATDTNVIIKNNFIRVNGYGYGVTSYVSNTTVEANTIWRDVVGGIGVIIGDPFATGFNIHQNEIRGLDWGIYFYNLTGSGTVNRNTVVKNNYGIYSDLVSGTVNVKNSIFAYGTEGIYHDGAGGTLTSKYNDVYSNGTNWDGISSGAGDQSVEARFVASGEANDFHLLSGSPCIGTGTPEGTDLGAYDYSPDPAPANTVVNCQDSGPGSLRQVMTDAGPGDTIVFDIPTSDPSYEAIPGGNVWVIRPKDMLPNMVAGNVYINGATQTVNQGDQNPYGPEIMISSEVGGGINLFNVASDHNTIEAVIINNVDNAYTIQVYGNYNDFKDCYIGTDATGETDSTNGYSAFWIDSGDYNIIEGHPPNNPSILSGHTSYAAFIFSNSDQAIGNIFRNNYIGVDRTAVAAVPNGVGIGLISSSGFGAAYTTIGGTQESDRNIISGNTGNGVYIDGGTTNEVEGNYIGVGGDGFTQLPNGDNGIYLVSSPQFISINTNVVSGNHSSGILTAGAANCTFTGNKIGTSADGLTAVANDNGGIALGSSNSNIIGGNLESERNIVSGNSSYGIYLNGTDNRIEGNYIGPSASGESTFGMQFYGILLGAAQNNVVGGSTIEARNIISGFNYGVFITGSNSNEVKGNFIGTNKTGTLSLGNGYGVDVFGGSKYNIVGGTTEAERNIISGNIGYGISIDQAGTDSNRVIGNYIGLDPTGISAVPNSTGLVINSGPLFNSIGGSTAEERNIISGNSNYGLYLTDNASSNEVKGNYIGLAVDGSAQGNAADGIYVASGTINWNVIGGDTTPEGNYIGGNGGNGIQINLGNGDGINNIIRNNVIGLAPDGVSNRKNIQNGIYLNTARNNLIDSNVISGHSGAGLAGIDISLSNNNRVTGNKLGTSRDGTSAIANSYGVRLASAASNVIGGSSEAERNIISGNSGSGIEFIGIVTSSEVLGNYIGTDVSGSSSLPNGAGIDIHSASNYNIIGRSGPGERNLISGNTGVGVYIYDNSDGNAVSSNWIGLKSDGQTALPNQIGVQIGYGAMGTNDDDDNIIGGDTAPDGNVISGNSIDGILVFVAGSDNFIKNNCIGLNASREAALPNSRFGIGINSFTGTLNIISNEVHNNNNECIRASGVTTDYSLIIHGCTLEGDGGYGVYQQFVTNIIDCRYNDWLTPMGPYDPENELAAGRWFNPVGEGLRVNDYIDYRYWKGWGTVVPDAPDPLTGIAASSTSINWNWSDNTTREALYYLIESPSGNTKATMDAGTTATTESGLSPYTEYTRKAVAWKMDASGESSAQTVRTLAPETNPPTVEVVVPNGGESWRGNSSHNIVFTCTDESGIKPDSANFYYTTGEGWVTIATGQPTDAAYAWTTPLISTTEAKVRVTVQDIYENTGTDESNAYFAIAITPSVEVVQPNGGEHIKGGASYDILFTATSEAGIQPNTASFYYTTGESWVTIATGQPTDAAYSWTTPMISTTEAKVRITVLAVGDKIGTSESQGFFSIDSAPPTVTVSYPNGGETLRAGRAYNISFACSDLSGIKPDSANFYYTTGESWVAIATGQPTDAAYAWTTPLISTTEAKVRVTAQDILDQTGTGESTSYFTIDITPSVEVTFPNGGQYLKGGVVYNISFTATSEAGIQPDTASFYYTTGEGWVTIATGQPTDAPYAWTTPSVSTTEAKVRVTALDVSDRIGTDESDGYFAIDSIPPIVDVLSPNGGEIWRGGDSHNLTWTASDNIGLKSAPITLKYSINNGTAYDLVAAGEINSGSYPWTVPAVNTNEAKVSITAEDLAGNLATVESQAAFTIDSTSPFVVSITPTDGATSVVISTEVIAVFSKEMSREAVQSAFTLSASPPVAGAFSWNTGGTVLTFQPAADLAYRTKYTVSISQSAIDLAGNRLASAFSSSFTTEAQSDSESPHCVLQVVDRDRQSSTLKSGDYIGKRPWFKGIVTDNLSIESSSVKFYLDEVLVSPVVNIVSPRQIELNYQVASDLEDETVKTHSLKLQASDTNGNLGEKLIQNLKVAFGTSRVTGPVLSYPQTFKPKSGTPAKLVYNLTADADIMVYLFSISGENVWSGKYLAGGAGGRAGYNEVDFDGRSLTNGTYLGNGIYTFKITANQRVIGTGYITIFD